MPDMLPVVLWGASGHASVVADALSLQPSWRIVGCIDDLDPRRRATAAGEVLGDASLLPGLLRQGVGHILIAIGDNAIRRRLGRLAQEMGFQFATAIHPRAIVASSAAIAAGCVLAAGCVVNPGAILGRHAIVNTLASIDHDCIIGEAAHICPGCHLAGGVRVGEETMIGIGSVVRDRVRIGSRCIIGAGSAVVSDIPDDVVAYGVPARIVRHVERIS